MALLALAATGLLGVLAWHHPELRLVDFVAFAGRARRVLGGLDLLSPRYPVGYPALLGLGKLALGDVLVAGKVLAVAAGVGAVLVTGRWLGLMSGLWLLVQFPLLGAASTEGTDLPALALALGALALAFPAAGARRAGADRKGVHAGLLAGALSGAAMMMRYPAALVLPVVLLGVSLRHPRGGRALGLALLGLVLVTAPHWLTALYTGAPLMPAVAENAAIGAGPQAVDALHRFWPGLRRALGLALAAWPARLGALGLLIGLLRRDRRAAALTLWGLLHLVLLGFFFSNPRLVLPATVAASLGVAFLVPRFVLLPLAGAVLWWTAPAAWQSAPGTRPLQQIVAAADGLPGPVASTSPWFYLRRSDGWLDAPVLIKRAALPGATPGSVTPESLVTWGQQQGIHLVVVDTGRVARTYPGLRPLLSEPQPGLVELARSSGWRLLSLGGS